MGTTVIGQLKKKAKHYEIGGKIGGLMYISI